MDSHVQVRRVRYGATGTGRVWRSVARRVWYGGFVKQSNGNDRHGKAGQGRRRKTRQALVRNGQTRNSSTTR
jgi:hypothetical protein